MTRRLHQRLLCSEGYLTHVPHYPLLTSDPFSGPIFQGWTIGRVRFIMTDLRSQADLQSDDIRTTLGSAQRDWLLSELNNASSYGLVVWVSSKPWMGPGTSNIDKWRGYPEERQMIADKVRWNRA
jgi:hypothetical protein